VGAKADRRKERPPCTIKMLAISSTRPAAPSSTARRPRHLFRAPARGRGDCRAGTNWRAEQGHEAGRGPFGFWVLTHPRGEQGGLHLLNFRLFSEGKAIASEVTAGSEKVASLPALHWHALQLQSGGSVPVDDDACLGYPYLWTSIFLL
jgi:hypothetical protein